jgi:hypothetical protein
MSSVISDIAKIAALVVLSPLAVFSGCGGAGDPGGHGSVGDEKDAGNDVVGKDAPADVAEDVVDASNDPCARTGVNSRYFTCDLGAECSIIDLDIGENPIIKMLAGNPYNRMGLIDIDPNDPMGMNGPVDANFGSVDEQFFIGTIFNGYGGVTPIQVSAFDSMEGIHIVPFSYEGALNGQQQTLSGLAFLDALSAPAVTPKMQGIDPKHAGSSLDLNIVGMKGGVRFEGEDGPRLGTAMYDVNSNNGVFLSMGFDYTGALDQSKIDFPVFLSGTHSGPLAMFDATHVAVLNPAGGTKPGQIDQPSIDIIDVTVSAAASSETSAQNAKVGTIALGAGIEIAPFPELPVTEDGRYAFVVGGSAGNLTTLYVIDLQESVVTGSLDLSPNATEVLGIDVREDKVALTVHGTERRDANVDDVLIIDIADASAPKIEKVFAEVGYGLGSIAMHEASGKLFLKIAAGAPWCEGPVAKGSPYSSIISLDAETAEYDSE